MRLTKKQRANLPLCVLGGKNHAWKLGSKLYNESGICGRCGYDLFDDLYRSIIEVSK